ncbi:MAG TPA: NUDIX domain-containing protein [Planctomycetota bacterium]|jgi:hypothetical protein|nr:hypothetical protein [Planctomycetota bacterium]MDP7245187.1 NUDIX domain-containing protein [Planctomycetota bacterium]MDP7560203.1 NUDIX domain-containing protein [Planctomycetota bacterium]HJM40553.1 NUDIX domain-containing protein [Planctomycetota bacterium]|tara:strand:+ start:1553 stop:2005 length:453 start_codon:yes stop_codon:yes gene_type:complete
MNAYKDPAGFGELGLRHEVNVFVFRVADDGIEYLLLQPNPQHDGVWRPVVHPVHLNEDLDHAALRGVREETGISRPFDLIRAEAAPLQEVGDLQLVGWPFAFQVRNPQCAIQDDGQFADIVWQRFDDALQIVTNELHRQNLLQLHLKLVA